LMRGHAPDASSHMPEAIQQGSKKNRRSTMMSACEHDCQQCIQQMCIWCVGMPCLCWLQQTQAYAICVCSCASRGSAQPLLLHADEIDVA
jgi:hypothetical protein